MQCYCSSDTSFTMDIHGLLETRGETRCWDESVSTVCLSKPTMNMIARDTANVIQEL